MKNLIYSTVIIFTLIFMGNIFSCSQPKNTDRLNAILDSAMANANIPGLMVSIVCGDFKWEQTRGHSDFNNKTPMDLNKVYRIGSITKTFTITAVFQLIDEGKLSLDDKIDKYLTGIPNGDKITIRQLMNMTSGLYNYSESKDFSDTLKSNPGKQWTPDDALAMAFEYPVYFEPGTGFHYSNTNTIVLGKLLEKLTGKTVAENITERIIKPLGLKNTYVVNQTTMPAEYIHGHSESFTNPKEYYDVSEVYNSSLAGAAGNIVSNINDLNIYIRALAKGELISAKSQAERIQWTPFDKGDPNSQYGLGMANFFGGYYGHNGGIPGFVDIAVYSPEKDCSIVMMYNIFTMFGNQLPNPFPDAVAKQLLAAIGK